MDTLPQELLIEIFQHLAITDLVNLSKVSANFREVIDTTPKLKFFSLKFDRKGKTQSEKSKRVAELTVCHYTPRIHQNALLFCGSNITNASFIGSSVSFAQIAAILRLTPNVRQIKFENCSTWPEVVRQLPQLNNNLNIQLIESSACILDIFLKSQVNALSIVSHSDEYGTGIRGFLQAQPQLKSLSCKGRNILNTFYAMGNSYSENKRHLPFRLEVLVLKDILWNPIYVNLLQPSARTLTYLEFIDVQPVHVHQDVEVFVGKCESLDELNLQNCYFSNISPLKLQKMALKGLVGPARYVRNMKKLKTLKITSNYTLEYDFKENVELANVEINDCSIGSSFEMPHVRKLVLNGLRKVPETLIGTTMGEIEEIEVVNCGQFTEQIVKEIGMKASRVVTLSVTDGRVNRMTMESVRRRLTNLKSFTTKNIAYFDE